MPVFKKIIHFLLAWSAYWWYGRPSRKLIVVGVTGTKGKSTSCRLIASVLEAGGNKVGLLTTVEFQIGDKRWLNDKKMTMLGRGQIQSMLRQMVKAGCKYAVVETSSEGILQYRHYGLNYDISVFTNLGTEHSERHGGFANLKRDKGKIFSQLMSRKNKIMAGQKVSKIIVANFDDQHADYFWQFKADEKYGFGIKNSAQTSNFVLGKNIMANENGSEFEVGANKYKLNILGEFNVYNALAAIAVGQSQNISADKIAAGLASVKLVEGRMELVNPGEDFKVIVDYAHEPMSLTELFKSLRRLVGADHKIISVIGSDGGGRDKGKRELMGELAGKLTDFVVVTDVNCYDEDPKQIAEMLAVGARKADKKDNTDLFVVVDRREAIAKAISLAKAGDVVVITAKGTEPFIGIAGGQKIPWDDRKVAREILAGLSK
ncbi:MAG TPA: UDP-N-acetylmuramoyl-L-alanyl-D-glutamate--2,6-diaminopimelate ligase [Candidatus Udaeobacter sp.]|nr:UDP-N-acetylmuramoyl-L-alanyl-D-glutamate--2,6-diaminopimelate ligase [Candidatus Udaeobacter sp.]